MRLAIMLMVLPLAGTLPPAQPVQAVQFSAEQTIRSDGHVHRSSLYYRDDMWRIEHNDASSIEITIVRKDKRVIWLLAGRTKRFATLPFDDSADVLVDRTMVRETGREFIGTEILDDHPTTLFQVTVQDGEQSVVYYQWWAEDLQLPLRLARQDGAWVMQYKNVKLRALSPRLFELPLSYRPVETLQAEPAEDEAVPLVHLTP